MVFQILLSGAFARTFTSFMTFLFVANAVSASSVEQLKMNDMLVEAELVFEGTVTLSEPRWNTSKTLIKTYITFDVIEVISGDYDERAIELSFVGGVIGQDSIEAEGLRQPQIGETGIYFVSSTTRSLISPLVGWSQGHFLLEKDEYGIDMVMTNEHLTVMGIQSITESARVESAMKVISGGVANDVVVNASSKERGMSASAFKQELKRRLKTLNN